MLTYTSCGAWRMSFQIRAHGFPSSYSSIEGNLNLHKPCGSRLLFFLCYFLFLFFSFNCMREREREREPFLSNNGSSGLFSLPCISFFLCCSEIFLLYLLCWWWTRFLITPLVKLVIFHKASLSPLWMNTIIHMKKSQHYPYFKEKYLKIFRAKPKLGLDL